MGGVDTTKVTFSFDLDKAGGSPGGLTAPGLAGKAQGEAWIESGRTAVEYLLRGASSFQMHTYFQLPDSEYRMRRGNRTERALHELYFNPERGLVAWLRHLRREFDWPVEWNIKQMAEYCLDPANRLWAEHEPRR